MIKEDEINDFCNKVWEVACAVREESLKRGRIMAHPLYASLWFIGCLDPLERKYDGQFDVACQRLCSMRDFITVKFDEKEDIYPWDYIASRLPVSKSLVKQSTFPNTPGLDMTSLSDLFNSRWPKDIPIGSGLTLSSITGNPTLHIKALIYSDYSILNRLFLQAIPLIPIISSNNMNIPIPQPEADELSWIPFYGLNFEKRIRNLQNKHKRLLKIKEMARKGNSFYEILIAKLYLKKGYIDEYKEILKGSKYVYSPFNDSHSVAHNFFWAKVNQIETRREIERQFLLLELAKIPQRKWFHSSFPIDQECSSLIVKNTEEQMKAFVISIWTPDNKTINEEVLKRFISYVNTAIPDEGLKRENSENIRTLFEKVAEHLYFYKGLDLCIHSKEFKTIRDIHIELPIEGEVCGIYLFEKYLKGPVFGEQSLQYQPQKLSMQGNSTKKSSNKKRNDISRSSSYKSKFNQWKNTHISKYDKTETNIVEDLLEYVDTTDFTSTINEAPKNSLPPVKESSNNINWFLMLARPSWSIFNRHPVWNQQHHNAFIFVKSELMRYTRLNLIEEIRRAHNMFSVLSNWSIESLIYSPLFDRERNEMVSSSRDNDLAAVYRQTNDMLSKMVHFQPPNIQGSFYEEFLLFISQDELNYRFQQCELAKNRLDMVEIIPTEEQRTLFRKWLSMDESHFAPDENEIKEFLNINTYSQLSIVETKARTFLEKITKSWATIPWEQTPYWNRALLMQICQYSDQISISPLKIYQDKYRHGIQPLSKFLEPKSKVESDIRYLMMHILERQFFYNLGLTNTYTSLMDFRISVEQKLLDAIKSLAPTRALKTLETIIKEFYRLNGFSV